MKETSAFDPRTIAAACIALFVVLIYVDHSTGHEFEFSPAYLIPVSLCAWFFRPPAVWLISLGSGAATWLTDLLSGHAYSHFMFHYWNGFTCFLSTLITGLLLLRIRRTLTERQRLNDHLAKALDELKSSTEEIRKLQDGLQVVCAWTKRLKVGDQWMTPDQFLSTQLHLKLTHGISPEAYDEIMEGVQDPARG
ncbi:MAG TPA: hypothetical protein VG796_00150 [Verrucomicrobiales bacterium]|jgi:hypothetical protein|nr:hypothetical protein [Verrucomicrobiales bacterium]